jgi:small-conductance mechanosensitive channel
VDLENDPRHVERVLLEIAESYPLVLTEPTPRVLLMELGPDTMLFEIRCWLRDVNFSLSAKSDMNFEIMERFAAEGIQMQPFQRDPRHPPPPPPPPGGGEAKQS